MRILVDYRAALRARTGVGEYIRELVRAYTLAYPADPVALFTSSWKDRPPPRLGPDLHAEVLDRHVPVRVLNLLWHRAQWPPIEFLTRWSPDIVHAAHPLMMPSRTAAQIVTIHDLFFLAHPERTRAEIRRDYPALAAMHARRADAIITSSTYIRTRISEQFGVLPERIYVCPPGPPVWHALGRGPHRPAHGCILFIGTLEPRKNIGTLLDAYTILLGRMPDVPPLVLAGRATEEAAPWLRRLDQAPLRGNARHLGYVPDEHLEALYASARVVVLPSFDEGFGLPLLEAMSAGIPIVAARRGSLPEVVGDAGTLVDPERPAEIAAALERLITDERWAVAQANAGLARARAFNWQAAAATLRQAYADALARRAERKE